MFPRWSLPENHSQLSSRRKKQKTNTFRFVHFCISSNWLTSREILVWKNWQELEHLYQELKWIAWTCNKKTWASSQTKSIQTITELRETSRKARSYIITLSELFQLKVWICCSKITITIILGYKYLFSWLRLIPGILLREVPILCICSRRSLPSMALLRSI